MRPIPPVAYSFVRRHELLVLRVYDDFQPKVILKPDTLVKGTLTAGYGHTGPEVQVGLKVTKALSEKWLREDLQVAAGRLYRRIGETVEELTANQYAALLSFVFNVGEEKQWRIWKRLKAREFDQVPIELMRFVYAKGKKLDGLVKRRAAEVELWSTGEPGSARETLPSSVTREIDTPPAATDPTPAHKKGTILAGAAGSVAAAPVMFQQVSQAISPYSDQSDVVQTVLGVLATAAAACAALSLGLMWLHQRHART